MKHFLYITGLIIFIMAFSICELQAQQYEYEDDNKNEEYEYDEVPERLKYFKDVYEVTYDEPFDVVFRAVKDALKEDLNCMLIKDTYKTTEEGFYKGIIRSDFCIFVRDDPTFDTLKTYSVEMPFIRGGKWINGRIQYKIVIFEQQDGTSLIKMKTEMSGMEARVTNRVHFWNSTGVMEMRFLDMVDRKITGNG